MLVGSRLDAILSPSSVAVIGASRDPDKVGHAIFRNLMEGGFQGVIYPVNPRTRAVRGVRAYASISEIPDPVDLAVVIVPASQAADVLDECGRKGVRGVVIVSAGFREIGEVGHEREERVREVVHRYGFPLVGPNCLGVLNTDPAVRLNATFAPHMPAAGRIAFISQSGALTVAVLDYAAGRRIGFSKVVSLGNKVDVTELDVLRALADDPATGVILLYVEDLSDGRAFIELARSISGEPPTKPIVAVKAGRTPAGARAASSHTGSLAGSDDVYDAIFTQAGVLRVDSVEELFDYALALSQQPLPQGRRVAILSNAGGPAIMATDACGRFGLDLATFTDETTRTLRERLPTTASVANPVDVIGDADAERYDAALEPMLRDPNVDAAIVLLTPQATIDVARTAEVVAARAHATGKPVLAGFIGARGVERGVAVLDREGIPQYRFPEVAVRALAVMARYREWLGRPRTGYRQFAVDRARADALVARSPAGFMLEDESFGLLKAYGLPLLAWRIVRTADEAADAARAIGFPVALKVLSPEIIHKVDVGGVVLDLSTGDEVRRAFASMMASVAQRRPDAAIGGAIVQQMAGRGRETILGLKRDPQFGPLLMFGLGGIYVEVLRDVTFRLAPVRELGARRMVESIRAAAMLRGVRGQPPADVDAVAEAIERLSQLAVEQPRVEELDINPLIAYDQGHGVAVVDARVRLSAAPGGG